VNSFQKSIKNLAREASEQNMQRVIDAVIHSQVLDEDLAYLATILGDSGGKRDFSRFGDTADVASSGGPSSLTTLICPLFLRSLGYCVPKISVPGRPSGGIDVMAQIPGFRFNLSSQEFENIISLTGFAHSLAQGDLAPLDARLFSYRQSVNAQAIGDLVVASLLSKKVALRIHNVGLDVRVSSYGNFGLNWEEARVNAHRFCRVSKLLGINSICILTNGSYPYQPFLGRGESLMALYDLFEGKACQSLAAHANLCFRIAAVTAQRRSQVRPTFSQLKNCFIEHLHGHGSNYTAFEETATRIQNSTRFNVKIQSEGFLTVKLGNLRSLLINLQRNSSDSKQFSDPCGVIFQVPQSTYVWPGDVVASVRIPAVDWIRSKNEFRNAFGTVKRTSVEHFYEEVQHG
jgi:pyrimidine-nucleoside phosphorylase